MLCCKSQSALGILYLVLISCTIVKDSDITSLDQLNKLKLSSIEIKQSLSGLGSGQSLTGIAAITDSAVNIPQTIDINATINSTLTKLTRINWPTVPSNSKLKFRSGATSGITIATYYFQNGMPRSTSVLVNGQLKEWYTPFYNANWQLTNFRSRIYNTADTIVYRDSLTYYTSGFEQGYVGSIVRQTNQTAASKAGTIAFHYVNYGSNNNIGLGSNIGNNVVYAGYNYDYGNCLCPNNSGNSCTGCTLSFGSGNTSHFIATPLQISTLLSQLQIEDIKISNSSSCNSGSPSTNYDTYYFHPLMLTMGLYPHGNLLLDIYSIDWWQPGSTTAGINITSPTETVTFNFNYGK
jgi:hypothetical protein